MQLRQQKRAFCLACFLYAYGIGSMIWALIQNTYTWFSLLQTLYFIGVGGALTVEMITSNQDDFRYIRKLNFRAAAALIVYMLVELCMSVQTHYARQLISLTVLLGTGWAVPDPNAPVGTAVVQTLPTEVPTGIIAQPVS